MNILKTPFRSRQNIPFYYPKTEAEFRRDPYEHYETMVIRQTAIHLADQLQGEYPFQAILDFILANIDLNTNIHIADIGCSVGRLIGELAQQDPTTNCYGIDYSYQLLRQAHDYWLAEKTIALDWASRGFEPITLQRNALNNLHLALAKAENLPFEEASLDVLCSSFLLDRLEHPLQGLREMCRVLKPHGQFFLITPCNFQKEEHWAQFLPLLKLVKQLNKLGFDVEKKHENLLVYEPIDARGNRIEWQTIAIYARKRA